MGYGKLLGIGFNDVSEAAVLDVQLCREVVSRISDDKAFAKKLAEQEWNSSVESFTCVLSQECRNTFSSGNMYIHISFI